MLEVEPKEGWKGGDISVENFIEISDFYFTVVFMADDDWFGIWRVQVYKLTLWKNALRIYFYWTLMKPFFGFSEGVLKTIGDKG